MNRLASIILIVVFLQFTTGSTRTVDAPENKPKFYIYFGQLQELSDYDSFKISASTLTFYGGAKMETVKSEIHNNLFSDSLYPLMTPWLNDSLVKTVVVS